MFRKTRNAREATQATAILVEAAASSDTDQLTLLLSGRGALDDHMLGRALVGMIGLASEYPDIQVGLRLAAAQAPDYAQMAFNSTIRCVEVGSASTFNGGTLEGQQLLMATLAHLIANDPVAYKDLKLMAKVT